MIPTVGRFGGRFGCAMVNLLFLVARSIERQVPKVKPQTCRNPGKETLGDKALSQAHPRVICILCGTACMVGPDPRLRSPA